MYRTIAAAIAAVSLAALVVTPAAAQTRAKVGTLDCDIAGGIGLIIASKKRVSCVYVPAEGGRRETYSGSISKLGVDIGVTSGARMVWAVYAATAGYQRGVLAGTYAGASAEATFIAGLGANVLVGGSNRSYALQPLSVQGQTGFNVAGGVTELQLFSGG
jgi:hypothetical protein